LNAYSAVPHDFGVWNKNIELIGCNGFMYRITGPTGPTAFPALRLFPFVLELEWILIAFTASDVFRAFCYYFFIIFYIVAGLSRIPGLYFSTKVVILIAFSSSSQNTYVLQDYTPFSTIHNTPLRSNIHAKAANSHREWRKNLEQTPEIRQMQRARGENRRHCLA
jgi:hypothetical protein